MKLAVVCAQNRDHNTGMITVDRAAEALLAPRAHTVDWFVLGKPEAHTHKSQAAPLRHRCLFEAPDFPDGYDRILFWGDFHHSHSHWQTLQALLVRDGIAGTEAAAREAILRRVGLEGASAETHGKTALLGSTIYADGAAALADARYQAAMHALVSRARSVRFRDPVSASRAKMITGRDAVAGMELAFRNMVDRTWNAAAQERRASGAFRIGVYCGRSRRGDKYRLLATLRAQALSARAGRTVEYVWLPWLRNHRAGLAERVLLGRRSADPIAADPLAAIAACDAVVTDTYHAFINAWCAGIPAVLIGSGAVHDSTSVGSKKKELLAYSMHAPEAYFYWESLSWVALARNASAIVAQLCDEAANARVFDRHREAARRFVQEITAEIGL